jgi:mono/diheme cytochrome c family protein
MPRRAFSALRLPLIFTAVVVGACSHSSAGPSPSPAPAKVATPPEVTPEAIAAGSAIFNTKSCKNCHMPNGVGGVRAPDLTDDKWIHIDGSYDAIVRLVTTGFTKAEQVEPKYQFSMNPRGGTNLTDAEIRSVAAYVWSLSHPIGGR